HIYRMIKSLLIFLLVLEANDCQSQDYQSEIGKAEHAYDKKQYDSCSFYFSNAFKIKNPNGSDLYHSAACNILNGNASTALKLLKKAIIKPIEVSKLKIDPDFDEMHALRKWKKLIKKADRIQSDSFKKYQYPQFAAQLATLWEKDQYYRFRLARAYDNNDTISANEIWRAMRKSDSANLLEFESVTDKIGWPTVSKVGQAGASTAFLIIDHSPREVMEQYFPLLEEAARKGEASLSSYATMKDRILVNRGKKQIYGTQKYWDQQQGKFVYFPIEDEKSVNSKRKEVGLAPLSEFEE
ncbi:MAG TPA: DUF6624 domain-containing protein, partial [Chitinophagaceae bacterium]|nr:DUF6624 domain-containing protein [Chitinophagaceae bacterium]